MSDIQRYILSPNPKLELADGCGKWCIYSDHIRDKAQAIEAKDREINDLKAKLEFIKSEDDAVYDGDTAIVNLCRERDLLLGLAKQNYKQIEKLKEQLGRGNPPSTPPPSTYGI